jgi:hypothetical protein
MAQLAFLDNSITAHQRRVLRVLRPRRSVARQITERLILGVAALALFGAPVLITPYESPGTTSSPPVHSIEKSQDRVALGEPKAAIQSMPTMPNWLWTLDVPTVGRPVFGSRPAHW